MIADKCRILIVVDRFTALKRRDSGHATHIDTQKGCFSTKSERLRASSAPHVMCTHKEKRIIVFNLEGKSRPAIGHRWVGEHLRHLLDRSKSVEFGWQIAIQTFNCKVAAGEKLSKRANDFNAQFRVGRKRKIWNSEKSLKATDSAFLQPHWACVRKKKIWPALEPNGFQ